LNMPQCALHERLGAGEPVLLDEVFLEASRVHADPHRDPFVPRLADHFLESLLATDVSRVDPDLDDGRTTVVGLRVEAGEGHAVVEVNIGDEWDLDGGAD